MAVDIGAGKAGLAGEAERRAERDGVRMAEMADRCCLMALDQVLHALPRNGAGHAAAARDVRSIALRIAGAARDLRAGADEAR
jgi:hypothetical protein